ncbi:MAG TPA: mannosyltransferase family protein [Ktedonobacterales bacterium]
MFNAHSQSAALADPNTTSQRSATATADKPDIAMRRDLPWRAIVLQALAVWAATRIAYLGFTYFALLYSSSSRQLTGQTISPDQLLSSWVHWDGYWYIRIATLGYYDVQSTAFFPLYPLLIHIVTLVLGQSHIIAAALLVSNLGSLGAFIGVALLAANEAGNTETSWRTLRILAAYPLAFFMTAPYTEGIFLAFAVAALFCARRGSWRWAILWALLAGFTRPTGVALILPMFWEYGRQHDWWRRTAWNNFQWRERLRLATLGEGILVVGAVPISVVVYMLYCWAQLGHPLAAINAERVYWGHHAMPFGQGLILDIITFLRIPAFSDQQAALLFNLVPSLVVIALTLAAIRRTPLAFTLYSGGVVYLSLASPAVGPGVLDILHSVGRYLVVAAPVFLLLALWSERRPWLDMLLTSGGFLIQAILALVYLHNGPVN